MASASGLAELGVGAGQGDGGGQAARHLAGEAGARTAPPGAAWAARLGQHLASSASASPARRPWRTARPAGPSRSVQARSARQRRAQVLGRGDGQDEVGSRPRSARSSVARDRRVQRHAGQEQGVLVRRVDRLDHLRPPAPTASASRPARRADLGQGRAPGAGADHADGLQASLMPWLPCGRGRGSGWASGGGLVQRPARPGDRVQAVDQARGQPLGAGQGDHGGVVGAVGQRRGGEGEAVRGRERRSRAARTAPLAATPPATTKRQAAPSWRVGVDAPWPARCARPAGGRWRAWTAAARSRRSISVVRPLGQARGGGLQAGEREVAALAAQQGAGQGKRAGVAALAPAAPAPGRRDRAGPAPWRSCRRPRRPRRRWSSPAAGRRPTPATSSSWQWPPETSSSRNGIGDVRRPAGPRRRGPPGG